MRETGTSKNETGAVWGEYKELNFSVQTIGKSRKERTVTVTRQPLVPTLHLRTRAGKTLRRCHTTLRSEQLWLRDTGPQREFSGSHMKLFEGQPHPLRMVRRAGSNSSLHVHKLRGCGVGLPRNLTSEDDPA